MFSLLVVLTLIASVLMICVVLVQKSKGGGLSSQFAGSNQIMGVRRTNSFIEKLTWGLAGAILLFAVMSSFFIGGASQSGSRVKAPVATEQVGGDYDTALPEAAAEPVAEPAAEQPAE